MPITNILIVSEIVVILFMLTCSETSFIMFDVKNKFEIAINPIVNIANIITILSTIFFIILYFSPKILFNIHINVMYLFLL